jgi:DNA-binding MarR family transcriptional regulator
MNHSGVATRRSAETPDVTMHHFVDDYLPAMLAQASHLISSEFHAVARAHGYSVSEWRVLATLEGGDPVSIGRLAQVAILKQPTVTRILDRMASDGIVERMSHASDRRVTLVRITGRGKRAVRRLKKLALEHEQRVLEPFGAASVATLKRMLRRMIELHETSIEEPDGVAP